MATLPSSEDVLFFIPDMGGFTKFVTETEVRHSQHIVKELLELLVDANQLALEVSEFEGDAVLFFRTGAPPSWADLLAQAKKMFLAFHTHLKQLEMLRICQCGACAGASRISLKFVVHLGPASPMDVKGHLKFIGKSIIVAHRLLKNSVPAAEYLLVTQDTLDRLIDAPAGAPPLECGSSSYDDIGEVAYRYLPMTSYLTQVKVVAPQPFRIEHPHPVLKLSRNIDAAPLDVYQRLIDLPARMQWIDGIQGLEFRDQDQNRLGTRHRCVRDSGSPEVVTSDVKIGPSAMEFWEVDVKKMSALRYLVEPAPGDATLLTFEVYLRNNLALRWVFQWFIRKKLEQFLRASIDNLARVLEGTRSVA